MRKGLPAIAFGLLLVAHPAAGWCDDDSCGEAWWDGPADETPTWEAPVWDPEPVIDPEPLAPGPRHEPPADEPVAYEPPVLERIAREPALAEPSADERPVPEPVASERPEREPVDKWAVAAEEALHHVDTVAIANERTTSGLRTTFTTTTETVDTEAAAKLIAPVGTGEASGYDDVLWNGRMRRADGRLVGGYLYENFVWDGGRWVHDKYVFFQDDLETGRLPAAPPLEIPPVAIEAPPSVPPRAPTEATPPLARPQPMPRTDPLEPQPRDRTEPPAAATPTPVVASPLAVSAPPPAVSPPPRAVRAAIALAPQADALGRIDVMRGRGVRLWARSFVDGAPGTVAAWRLRSGELTAIGPVSGSGDEPLTAMWERISPPGDAFIVSFDVTVSVPAEGLRTVPAAIAVVVRSPAVVE